MSWQNRAASQILHEENVCEYPFVQYVNDGNTLTPAEPTGGFAITADQVEVLGATPHGATEHTLTFSTGESDGVFFTDWLRFAPLATRFAWVKDGNRLDTFVPGARGKLQALGYVETETGFAGPVMLTVKGMASKDLSQALREHRQAVRKATQGQAPSPFFQATAGCRATARRGTDVARHQAEEPGHAHRARSGVRPRPRLRRRRAGRRSSEAASSKASGKPTSSGPPPGRTTPVPMARENCPKVIRPPTICPVTRKAYPCLRQVIPHRSRRVPNGCSPP